MSSNITVYSGPTATLIVPEGSAALVNNPGPNTVYLGDSNAIRATDSFGVVPLAANGFVNVDGSQDLYGITSTGQTQTVNVLVGGINFFSPPSLSGLGGAAVYVQATAPTQPPTIPLNSLWFNTTPPVSLNYWNGSSWVVQAFAGTQLISAGTIVANLIAAGQVYAGFVDGTLISGATLQGTGAGAELLCYSGAPALGNLVAAVSGTSGTDSQGNAYTAGLLVDQGQLILANSSTPPSSSIGPVVFGQSNGSLQVVDSLDGTLYATEHRLRPQLLADIIPASTSAQAVGSMGLSVGVRSYRLFLHARCAIGGSSTTPKIRFNTANGAVTSMVEIAVWGVQQSLTGQSVFGSRYNSLGSSFYGNIGSTGQGWGANSEVDIFMDGWVTFSTGGNITVEIALGTAGNNWTLRQGSYAHYFPF